MSEKHTSNRKSVYLNVLLIIAVAVAGMASPVMAQTTIWSEDFQSYAEGTTQGSGSPPKWTGSSSHPSLITMPS